MSVKASSKTSRSAIILAATLLSVCTSKSALAGLTIIDFNTNKNLAVQTDAPSATTNNYSYALYSSSYTSHGFTFQNSHIGNDAFLSWSNNSIFNADPTGATLAVNYGHTSTTIHQNNGGIFNLKSLDLADVYNGHGSMNGGTVRLDFTTSKGITSEIVNLATTAGLHTFNINKNNLLSFSLTGLDTQGQGWLQLDNVKVYGTDLASTVPEAATWLMMLTGFAFTGFALRRRAQLVQVL